MARLKKGEKKKVQMTIRIAPEVAEKLKSIDKYSRKVESFIDVGIYEYEKWLNKHNDNNNVAIDGKNKTKKSVELKESLIQYFDNKECREDFIENIKENLKLDYKSERFGKFHSDIIESERKEKESFIYTLENWEEFKKNILDNSK